MNIFACSPWAWIFVGGLLIALVGAYRARHKLFFRAADALDLTRKQKGALIGALFPFLSVIAIAVAFWAFVLDNPDSFRDLLECRG